MPGWVVTTIAITPSLIVGNDLRRNFAVLLNRMPPAKAAYSQLNAQRERDRREAVRRIERGDEVVGLRRPCSGHEGGAGVGAGARDRRDFGISDLGEVYPGLAGREPTPGLSARSCSGAPLRLAPEMGNDFSPTGLLSRGDEFASLCTPTGSVSDRSERGLFHMAASMSDDAPPFPAAVNRRPSVGVRPRPLLFDHFSVTSSHRQPFVLLSNFEGCRLRHRVVELRRQ